MIFTKVRHRSQKDVHATYQCSDEGPQSSFVKDVHDDKVCTCTSKSDKHLTPFAETGLQTSRSTILHAVVTTLHQRNLETLEESASIELPINSIF